MDEGQQQSHRRIDTFAVLLAIFILGLGAYLSTFPAEIVRLIGILLMGASIVGLFIWFSWGHVGKVAGGKLQAAIGVLALSAILIGGYVASHWPTNFLKSAAGESPPPVSGPLTSRMNHLLMSCDVPPPPSEKTVTDSLWELHDYKQKLDILGDAIGLSFTMVTIRGGLRIEAEAATDEAKQRMLPLSSVGVTKFTIEIRRFDRVELVSVIIPLPPQLAFWALITPNPAASDTIAIVRRIEHFLGFKPGICQLV